MEKLNIKNPFLSPVYFTETTDSTMTALKKLPSLDHGTVLAAGYQSAGRGRLAGRSWKGSENRNIYFSMYLDAQLLPFLPMSLSVRIAFAVADFLESEYAITAKVKWPNDVLARGRKISGILLEARKNEIILGCGINCAQTDFESFPTPATSIRLESGSEDMPPEALEKLLPYLYREVSNPVLLETRGQQIFRLGEQIQIITGHPDSGEKKSGTIAGFNEDGSLRLQTLSGIEAVYSGEVVKNGKQQ